MTDRADRLRSMRWVFEEHDYPELNPQMKIHDRTLTIKTLGQCLRMEGIDELYPASGPIEVKAFAAWNTVLFSSYGEQRLASGIPYFNGVVNSSCGNCLSHDSYLTPLERTLFMTDKRLIDFLRNPSLVVREITDNGTSLVSCTVTIPDESCAFEARLDPAHDWLPVFLSETFALPGNELITEEYRVTEIMQANVAVPKRAFMRVSNPNVDPGYRGPCVMGFTFSSVKQDSILGNDDFVLKLPVGTEAFDEIDHISFIAGKAVVVVNDDGLHYHVSQKYFPQLDKYVDYQSGLSEEEWNASDVKKMVDDTWAELDNGKIIPKSQGASPGLVEELPPSEGRNPFAWIGGAALLMAVGVGLILAARQHTKPTRGKPN